MSQRRSDADALARERLATQGLPADQPLEALDRLATRWGEEPALEALVVSLVAGLDDPTVGAKLNALEQRTKHRPVRREIKRALYRLAQRGLWQPPTELPPSASGLLGARWDERAGLLREYHVVSNTNGLEAQEGDRPWGRIAG